MKIRGRSVLLFAFLPIVIALLPGGAGCAPWTVGGEKYQALAEVDAKQTIDLKRVAAIKIRHEDRVVSLAISPNGEHVVYSTDFWAYLWDPSLKKDPIQLALDGPVAFAGDDLLLGVDRGTRVVGWDIVKDEERFSLDFDEIINVVAVSRDRRWLAVGLMKSQGPMPPLGQVILCEMDADFSRVISRRSLVIFQEGPLYDIAFSPDGSTLVAGTGNRWYQWGIWSAGRLHAIDLKSGKSLRDVPAHKGWVVSVTFNADGSLLASAATDGTVKVWKWPSLELVSAYDLSDRGPYHGAAIRLCWIGEGRQFLLAGGGRFAVVIGIEAGVASTIEGAQDCVAVSQRGRLATASMDDGVILWERVDLAKGRR